MAGINREYKDRLFKFIFGNEANKAWALSLYNAVNNSSYDKPEDIKITTIDDAVYMGMRNDVSFLISDYMNLYEQQSTYNPNMPLRYLQYLGLLYSAYVKENHLNLYSPYLQVIPAPRCICFYNGTKETETRSVLHLSDASKKKGDVEVNVLMYNIGYEKNRPLLDACKPLNEYSWFVEGVRKHQKEGMTLKEAVNRTLEEMPDDFQIKTFLMSNREKVESMCITEFNETEHDELLRKECEAVGEARGEVKGEAKGKKEGKVEGTIMTLVSLIKDGILTEESAAERAGMSVEEFRKNEALYCS